MMTKLEQAARQALEALEEMFHSNSTKVAVEKYNTAHNALREALAEQSYDEAHGISSYHLQETKQAEQEPVGFQAREIGEGDWFDVGLDEIARITGIINSPILDYRWIYAAPVRTKDLTDEEMEELCRKYARFELIREAIAADREKNRV